MNRKPRVFIGSSSEAIPFARAVAKSLERMTEVNAWFAGTFEANDYTMEALERELDANDFGIFLFAAEDITYLRKQLVFQTRDNTLFEMGLFWGRLGRRRVFSLVPTDIPPRDDRLGGEPVAGFHLPSDFNGLTLLHYQNSRIDKPDAAVLTACGEIESAIAREGIFVHPEETIASQSAKMAQIESMLHFYWEYTRHLSFANQNEKYAACVEGVRNALIPPLHTRIMGAAIWKVTEDGFIAQAAGNVGRGRKFDISANAGKKGTEQYSYVVDTHTTGEAGFFRRREIATVYILCYPLGKKHVLSVHISGIRSLSDAELNETIAVNEDLLLTLKYLIGGGESA